MKRIRLNQTAIMVALLGLSLSGAAQTVYRVMGPDGKLTFSDKPPTNASTGKVIESQGSTATSVAGTDLPFELRQVVSRFPITLYSSNNCAPCGAGRALLVNRGIPFTERSVNTPADAAALTRATGESTLPTLTVGGQRLIGYSQSEWAQTLDAAGYPPNSILPANYKYASATPLAPVQLQLVTKPQESPPPAPSADPTPANPAGIRF